MHQLENADQMRHKLINLFQQIESLSGQLLKYDPSTESHDQLKLQRNIRFYAINYLKENSFTLGSLPTPEEYGKLKSQRQVYLIEELRRAELEHLKQQKQISERAAQLQNKSSDLSNSTYNNAKTKITNVSVDNSNGWIPQINRDLYLDENEDELLEATSDDPTSMKSKKINTTYQPMSDVDRALRLQIQLVEGYLKDARKQNKLDEILSLEQNLNELLNNLVDR